MPIPEPNPVPVPEPNPVPIPEPPPEPDPKQSGGAAEATAEEQAIAQAVVAQLNADRASQGLPPLRLSSELSESARAHNKAMTADRRLSHQASGEADLFGRIGASGYQASGVAENVAMHSLASKESALQLQRAMFTETPPNDGHRRNMLNTSYQDVGVDVFIKDGTLWMTQHFAAPTS
ncbi:MAG: hypothetical protein CSA58_01405 [Micrococcales bacterium]|nr:MAG: hypothetical protein CSA58_01405 [Micrococcales bacterium]